MKRGGTILLLSLVLAGAAYLGGYLAGSAEHRGMLKSDAPELAWLKQEFNLSNSEFERISQLHRAYLPRCAERCRRIDETNAELKQALARAGTVTPEVESKLSEAAALRMECQKEMLAHFLAVSRAMPAEQGRRYLSWIEEQTFMPEHKMSAHH